MPLRILWAIKGLGPGGAERLLVAAAAARDRAEFEVEVVYLLPGKDHLVPDLEALGVRCTCLDVSDERDLRWAVRFRRLLTDRPVDVVHFHSPYVAGVGRLVARSLPRRRRPALVTTEHNPWSTYRWPTRFANAASAPLDDAVITVSDDARASLPPKRRARAVALPHGVPIEQIRRWLADRDEIRAELGLDAGTFAIGTVANYHRKKDWPTLLRAAATLTAERPEVRFVAVGQGPLEEEVKRLHAELGLAETVTLTGYRSDAVRLMAAVDAFVLATRWEGLPVALMEAQALGLPIVASAVGGIPEHFTDEVDALLVPSGDGGALVKALERLIDDPALRERLVRASTDEAGRFDASRSVERVETIYRSVHGTRGPEPR